MSSPARSGSSGPGVVFSDIDGTLCFHEGTHGVRAAGRTADGQVLVVAPGAGRRYQAYDVSTSRYRAFLGAETRRLCHRVRERHELVGVTGARPATIRARAEFFDFFDAVIAESGGAILDSDFEPDQEWSASLDPERRFLPEVEERLRAEGWALDVQGRTSAIRVRRADNPHKTRGEFELLRQGLELPSALRKTSNLGHLDIILAGAGKGNAVRHLMASRGDARSVAIGDDVNDLEFLELAGTAYVLASAFPEVL
jgi:hydroxymethylpyrimidine pyrophosphatase-like HAD family hydrolase